MITSGKEVVRRSYELISANDLDGLVEVVDEDVVLHDQNEGTMIRGRAAFIDYFRQYGDAFPDLRLDIADIISEGDLVSARFVGHGRHTGELAGIAPTNRDVEVHGIELTRVRNGRIQEVWQNWDAPGLFDQLGASVQQQGAIGTT